MPTTSADSDKPADVFVGEIYREEDRPAAALRKARASQGSDADH
jgi:hypothetical protein